MENEQEYPASSPLFFDSTNKGDDISKLMSSLIRGTGEAYLLIRDHYLQEMEEYLLVACRHNMAYDAQCEGSRGSYLWPVIQLLPEPKEFLEKLQYLFFNDVDDDWGQNQMYDLFAIAAAAGDESAAQALLDRYQNPFIESLSWLGKEEIIRVHGLEGLNYILRKDGEIAQRDGEFWLDDMDWILDEYSELEDQFPVLLERWAEEDELIGAYRKRMQENLHERVAQSEFATEEEKVEDYLKDGRPLFGCNVNKLSPAFLRNKAEWLLSRELLAKPSHLWSLFGAVEFPLGYMPLIEQIQELNPKNENHYSLLSSCVDALALFSAVEVRELVLEGLNSLEPLVYLPLLINNFAFGDEALIMQLLLSVGDEDESHNWGLCLLKIIEGNSRGCWLPLIEYFYKTQRCSQCRGGFVRLLKKCELPKYIKNEIAYDSGSGLRA